MMQDFSSSLPLVNVGDASHNSRLPIFPLPPYFLQETLPLFFLGPISPGPLLSASAFVSVCVVLFSRAHGCGAWCLWQMKTDSPSFYFFVLLRLENR